MSGKEKEYECVCVARWPERRERQVKKLWRYFSRAVCLHWEEKEQRGSCLEEIWPVGSFANAFLSCYTSSMAPLFPIIPQCFRLKCTSRNTGPHSPITHVRLSPTMICYCQNNLIVLSFWLSHCPMHKSQRKRKLCKSAPNKGLKGILLYAISLTFYDLIFQLWQQGKHMETVMLKLKIEITVQGNNGRNIISQHMINYQLNYIEFITIGIQFRGGRKIVVREAIRERVAKKIWSRERK